MRDDLTAIFIDDGERNPIKAAQREMRRPLPKRFYKDVTVEPLDGGFGLALDGKSLRTPARAVLAVPTRALAESLAAEWLAQGEFIEPATMPVTRLVNTALDGVFREIAAVAGEIAKFAASDLLFYRAAAPDSLVAAQDAAWNPILDHFRDVYGAHFICAQGVIFVEQPATSVAAVASAVEAEAARPDGAFRLAALHVLTSISGSVLLALALTSGAQKFDEAWDAAHVDEDFQARFWGADEEAEARRAARQKDFRAAYELYAALG
jgi:chaperone required for assembly of F1-ATPase